MELEKEKEVTRVMDEREAEKERGVKRKSERG